MIRTHDLQFQGSQSADIVDEFEELCPSSKAGPVAMATGN